MAGRKGKTLKVLTSTALITLLCSTLQVPGFVVPLKAVASETKTGNQVAKLLEGMTLEEKVGQMMMLGFYGNAANADAEKIIKDYHAGGVVLFNWSDNIQNPQQTAAMNNGLQSLAKIPLLIAADQEGGIVARVTANAAVFPGNMALGATRDTYMAKEAGKITGEELRAIGINMDLAPDVDVNTNPANPVIGVRSYGENPDLVAKMGAEMVAGLQQNVVATAKHFPGHGDTNVDSHVGLPIINKTVDQLEKVDLVPFKKVIEEGIDAIMTAHIEVPALDPTPNLPATLSKPILTGLLREKLGFQGLIITDSMTMAGVAQYYGGVPKAAVKAIDAGADMILLTPSLTIAQQGEVYQEILNAVKSGTLSEERINQSTVRVLEAKQKHGLLDPKKAQVDLNQIDQRVGTQEHLKKAQDIADRAMTLVKNDGNVLPIRVTEQQKIAIISQYSLIERVKPYHSNTVEMQIVPLRPKDDLIRQAVDLAKDADVIIAGNYNANVYTEQAKLVKALQDTGKPVIVVAFRNPYDLMAFPEVEGYIATYGSRPELLQALVDVMFGAKSPSGLLPVTIPGIAPYGSGMTFDKK